MSEPLRLHPDDATRLHWQGSARFLLGSTEHYGAVLNAAFDYERYLDTLAADGINLTREKCVYRELEGSMAGLGHANPQAPLPEDYLAPWARGLATGATGPDGLPQFDLETWDERFLIRLRRFLAVAAARGVVVELVFFGSPHGDDLCRLFPLHPAGNVNGVGAGMARWQDFMTLADPSVVEHQRRMVRRVVAETNAFDNLYYEICNEPVAVDASGRPSPDRLRDWQQVMIETVRESERTLPKRHLVAVNCQMSLPVRAPEGPLGLPVAVLDDGYYRHNAEVDLLNFHYISHRLPREGLHHLYPGGARPKAPAYRLGQIAPFVALRAAAGKAIGFDEDFAGIVHGQPPRPAQKRMEAWEALLGGCATYDHLDFTFTTDDPTGSGRGTPPAGLPREWFDGRELRRWFGHVAAFATALDLNRLRPDLLAVQQAPWNVGTVAARAVRDRDDVLLVYLADLRQPEEGFGTTELAGQLALGGGRPGARYAVRRLDPRTGGWSDLQPVEADGWGGLRLQVPPFREDHLVELTVLPRTGDVAAR